MRELTRTLVGMAGRYPEASSQTQNRNRPAFDWTVLPAEGRLEPAPDLPAWRDWTRATEEWWANLWSSPEATQWDQSGRTLERLAVLHHQLVLDDDVPTEKSRAATLSAEMRAIEDRHGLSPKSKLQLRWMVAVALPGAQTGATVIHLVPEPDAEDEHADEAPVDPVVPKKRDGKPLWIAWAVSCGATPDQAGAMSKSKLVEVYASATPGEGSPVVQVPESSAVRKMRAKMAEADAAKRGK